MLQFYNQAISVDPTSMTARRRRGEILLRSGKASLAVQDLTVVNRIEPSPETQASLALAFLELQDFEKAKTIFVELSRVGYISKSPGLLTNFAQVEIRDRNFSGAKRLFHASIELDPTRPYAYHGLGEVHFHDDRLEDAIKSFSQAVHLAPGRLPFRQSLANTFLAANMIGRAIEEFHSVLGKEPNTSWALRGLGYGLLKLGKRSNAAEIFRIAQSLDPKDPEIRHFASILSASGIMEPSSAYAAALFDGMADRFDHHLSHLKYVGPEIIRSRLQQMLPSGSFGRVLDLGCGTGQIGLALRSQATYVAGVDISERMVELARGTGAYNLVIREEAVEALSLWGAESIWDIVVAADALPYFGALDNLFGGVSNCLKLSGFFVFTVEDCQDCPDGTEFLVKDTGRTAHSRTGVRRTALKFGLKTLVEESVVIREEAGIAVNSVLYILERDSMSSGGREL